MLPDAVLAIEYQFWDDAFVAKDAPELLDTQMKPPLTTPKIYTPPTDAHTPLKLAVDVADSCVHVEP